MYQRNVVEKIKTYLIFNNFFPHGFVIILWLYLECCSLWIRNMDPREK